MSFQKVLYVLGMSQRVVYSAREEHQKAGFYAASSSLGMSTLCLSKTLYVPGMSTRAIYSAREEL
jgi:hypothetical protein